MTTQISIKSTISADIAKVWDFYTKPEHIIKWNFASDDWQCPSATNDLRVGGKYVARMEAKDGSFGFDFEAIYDAIEVGKSFSYNMFDGRNVKVVFEDQGNNTSVSIIFDAETENPIELQRDGWQMILNNFKHYVEKS